jgi:hypothetical protein
MLSAQNRRHFQSIECGHTPRISRFLTKVQSGNDNWTRLCNMTWNVIINKRENLNKTTWLNTKIQGGIGGMDESYSPKKQLSKVFEVVIKVGGFHYNAPSPQFWFFGNFAILYRSIATMQQSSHWRTYQCLVVNQIMLCL